MDDCELFSQNVYNVPQAHWPGIIRCKSRINPNHCGIRIGEADHAMELLVLHGHFYVAEFTRENAIRVVSQFFLQMKSWRNTGDAVEELNADDSPVLSASSFASRATGYEKWSLCKVAGCIIFFANMKSQ